MKKAITLLVIILTTGITNAQQPFDCNEGKFYQVISGALRSYDPITGTYSDPLHTHTAYNAGGYNPVDNFLYAIRNSDKHLLRIGKDLIVDLGAVAQNGGISFGGGYAADVDSQGNLWVFQNAIDKQSFHKITNLQGYDGSSSPVFEIVVSDQASPSTCADIVFIDGNLYGGSKGNVYKWDLTTATPAFSYKSVSGLPSDTFGACYTDTSNRLYVSSNKGGLYLVNDYQAASPYSTMLNLTEVTNSNDGFKCAIGISPLDKDQDGALDSMDADTDGDGISNTTECNGTNPYGDNDGDNLYNYLDNDISGNGDNVVQDEFDRDGDGNPDFLDIDSDNDGIYDIVEAGQGDKDTNNDGVYNSLDTNFQDTDLDGLADAFDPDQGNGFTPIDTDNDTIYDCYDIDSDNDGVVDIIEGQNSATYQSLSNVDADSDGMDDAFDSDQGGTINGTINTDGTDNYDHLDTDSDNDGISDSTEAYDSDGDGTAETTSTGTDSDNDGLDDGFDLKQTSFDPENGGQTPAIFPLPTICDRYNYLGSFSSDGTPQYLDGQDTITQETLDLVNNALPEGYPVPDYNPHYISSGYDTDLTIEEQADVWVTFVGEGAGYKNTLGFYTYDINSPSSTAPAPEDITIIFPNTSAVGSGGGLQVGDKVKIGTFPANTGIGWVLLANAWSDGCVGTGHWQVHSNPDFNPESNTSLRPHNVLISDPDNERLILGFEDIRRDYASCDNDFNDALFFITANPYSAISTSNCVNIDSASNVSSGNNGGLESNGDLASLIAKRNFLRSKTNNVYNQKKLQKRFTPGQKSNKTGDQDLSIYFPATGALGTETSFVSSPDDLIGITNATSVFSIDYYDKDERVGVALATSTMGSVYDHSKTICDRLNGSVLEDVRTLTVRNHTLVHTKIRRATGEIEQAIHFSVRIDEFQNELYSLWNIDQYPEGDYLNFQIWGGSIPQIANIANTVIDKLVVQKSLGKTFIPNNIPPVFVQKGFYKDGKLFLDIVNKTGVDQFNFRGNQRVTELSNEQLITKTISLSGEYQETVTVETGYIFDIGFTIASDDPNKTDALYLADGPWGTDYQEENVNISSFTITKSENREIKDNYYAVERDAKANGSLKETFNLFRNILGGDLTLDISEYEAIEFELFTDKDVEVILVTEDLTDWNNRLRYTIKANGTKQMYNIPLSDFSNASKNNVVIKDLRSVVFSINGDYKAFSPFSIEISKLAFTIEKTGTGNLENTNSTKVTNSPNPFSTKTTIKIPIPQQKITISVIDMLGRVVQKEELDNTGNLSDTFTFTARNLEQGVYKYIINSQDTKKQYEGSFLIQ